MKPYYIQYPYATQGITIIKCKAKRNKPAKPCDVPVIYHKDPKAKVKNWFYNANEDIKFFIRRIKNDY